MLKNKTQKRLTAAINSVTELKAYLERTLRKLPEDSTTDSKTSELVLWLNQQIALWRQRRDTESKASEAYRFFDGKSEGVESVLRFLQEQSGVQPRSSENKGYLSARDQTAGDASSKETATLNLYDTLPEQELA